MAEENGERELQIGTLADLLGAREPKSEGVIEPVPEWGFSVRLRGLTRGEVMAMQTKEDGVELEAFVFSRGVVEPATTEEEAAVLLESKGFQPTQRVLNRIMEVSGLTEGFRQVETDPVLP